MAHRKQKRDTSGRFHALTPTNSSSGNSSASGNDTSSNTKMFPIVPSHRCEPFARRVMIIIDSSGESDDGDNQRRYQVPASGSGTKRQQAAPIPSTSKRLR
ncbi:hypothetical protein GUJ93_ZPchr0004g39441 [Zizania palustris]|uniref:Uncharacterized protein n=1 Tax=Zizania palustris TaxID=103762 RepID=A0A8J5VYS9_ZIZPA|nr:hypothetical protein GUJ93_ZPchr0004g39441 [Zizania palustris]